MKKYIFILTILSLLVGNFAYARIDLSTDTDKVAVNDNILSVKVDFLANTAQINAQKIVYTGSTKTSAGTVLQAVSGSISVNSTSNPNVNGTATITINLDKAKHPTGTTFTLYLADNDGSNFTTSFNTPSSYKTAAGSGDFYYTTGYDLGVASNYSIYKNDINNSFFRFTTLAACTTAWQKAIDDMYSTEGIGYSRKTIKFTECFESKNLIPALNTFIGKLKEYGTFSSSVPFYYYSWNQYDNTWGGSIGFKTKDACDKREKLEFGKGIVSHCAPYSIPPKQPVSWNGNAVNVTPTPNTPYKDEYKLLAPIPGLTEINSTTTISDYLNIIFKVGIGLLIALSVIMLVIHGVQYMGDESVFGKTEAMHSIRATIGGLLLALGAYAILNTINPDLVNGSLNIKKLNFTITPTSSNTSTGATSTMCVKSANDPNPDDAKGWKIDINAYPLIRDEYIPAIDKNLPLGAQYLLTAHTIAEGFSKTNGRAYPTHNPGNIGNTDPAGLPLDCGDFSTIPPEGRKAVSKNSYCFKNLTDGINAQAKHFRIVANKNATSKESSYVVGGTYAECTLGGVPYDGSLYQYLWIYAGGARLDNGYANIIIGYFDSKGKTITARSKMWDIYNIK